jgi:hypothetical protein
MDLEAAHHANSRAGRLTNAGMLACFVFAGVLLITSLVIADTSLPTQTSASSIHVTLP